MTLSVENKKKRNRKKHLLEVIKTQQKSVPLTIQYLQSAGKYYISANTASSKHNQNDKQ